MEVSMVKVILAGFFTLVVCAAVSVASNGTQVLPVYAACGALYGVALAIGNWSTQSALRRCFASR